MTIFDQFYDSKFKRDSNCSARSKSKLREQNFRFWPEQNTKVTLETTHYHPPSFAFQGQSFIISWAKLWIAEINVKSTKALFCVCKVWFILRYKWINTFHLNAFFLPQLNNHFIYAAIFWIWFLSVYKNKSSKLKACPRKHLFHYQILFRANQNQNIISDPPPHISHKSNGKVCYQL